MKKHKQEEKIKYKPRRYRASALNILIGVAVSFVVSIAALVYQNYIFQSTTKAFREELNIDRNALDYVDAMRLNLAKYQSGIYSLQIPGSDRSGAGEYLENLKNEILLDYEDMGTYWKEDSQNAELYANLGERLNAYFENTSADINNQLSDADDREEGHITDTNPKRDEKAQIDGIHEENSDSDSTAISLALLADTLTDMNLVLDERIDSSLAVMEKNTSIWNTAFPVIMAALFAFGFFTVADGFIINYYLQNHDSMTRIGNQRYITRKGGFLYQCRKLQHYSIIFLNIRDCKYINTTIGNSNGDMVIIRYAQILKKLIRGHGYIGRMGGDNFLLCVENDYLDTFLSMVKEIVIPISTGDEIRNIRVRCRVGIARTDYDTPYRELINHAATALSQAKSQSEDAVVYEMKLQESFIREKEVQGDFKRALEAGEFIPYYQPKVSVATGRLCGAEALARWLKDGEVITPYYFVNSLERSGQILQLDYDIFDRICQNIRKWLDAGLTPVRISSNFSKLHLKNPEEFADYIIDTVRKYDIDGKYIEIELTESSGCEDFELLKIFADRIKRAGLGIAIDDFGTGYSSLSMLRSFQADVVKLDKSFLDSADAKDERKNKFIVDIIQMIDHQEEKILCEGVETKEQLEFLREAGCDIIQGYYYDRPLPIEEFEKRLANPVYEA